MSDSKYLELTRLMKLIIIFVYLIPATWANTLNLDNFAPNFYNKFGGIINTTAPSPADFGPGGFYNGEGGIYVGNGADAIVCKDRVELLDIYEGKKIYQYKQIREKSFESLGRDLIHRLNLFDSFRAKRRKGNNLEDRFLEFTKDTDFTEDALEDLPDSGGATKPRDCDIQQIAIQFRGRDLRGKRYIVDKILWEQTDALSKAALVLHEFFAEDYFKEGHRNTLYVRRLISFLLSDEFLEVAREMQRSSNFFERERLGIALYYHYRLFRHNWNLHNIQLIPQSFEEKGLVKFKLVGKFEYSYKSHYKTHLTLELESDEVQSFFYDGSPAILQSAGSIKDYIKINLLQFKGHEFTFFPREIGFHSERDKGINYVIQADRLGQYTFLEDTSKVYIASLYPINTGLRIEDKIYFDKHMPEFIHLFGEELPIYVYGFWYCVEEKCPSFI